MTHPLDEKGLAAAKVAWTGDARLGLYPEQEAALSNAIRAYLVALTSSSMEVEPEIVQKLRHQHETVGVTPELQAAKEAYGAAQADHQRIWLEPAGAPDRCWCSDNQWDEDGVEYVLASAAQATIKGLEAEIERLKEDRDAGVRNLLTMQAAANKLRIRAEAAEAERDALRAEVDRCHARLEIDHVFVAEGDDFARREVPMDERLSMPDAVECRDATIFLLEEDLRAARKAMEGGE